MTKTPCILLILLMTILGSGMFSIGQGEEATSSSPVPYSQFVKKQTFFALYFPDLAGFSKNLALSPLGDFWRDANARPWREAVVDEWKTITSKSFDPFPILKQSDSLLITVSFPETGVPYLRNLQPAIICKLQNDKVESAKEYVKNILTKWTSQNPEVFKYSITQLEDAELYTLSRLDKEFLFVAFYKNYVVLTNNRDFMQNLLTPEKSNPTWSTGFVRTFKKDTDLFIWMDFSLVLNTSLQKLRQVGGELQLIRQVIPALGIDRIQYMYASVQFQKGKVLTEAGCIFDGDRSGLFALLKPVSALPIIKTVEFPERNYGAISHVSLLENFQRAREQIRQLKGEQGEQQINMVLAMIQLMTGLNLEQDILALFGTQSAFVMKGALDGALVTQLTNPQKFDYLITTLCQRFQLRKIDFSYNGLQYFQFAGQRSRTPLFFARTQRHLVISTNQILIRQVLAKVIEYEKSPRPVEPAEEKVQPKLVARIHSPGQDLSFLTSIGDLIIAGLNRQPGILKAGGFNPLLVPDFTVLMDHSFPIETEIFAGKDFVTLRSRSPFGLGGELIPCLPAIASIVRLSLPQMQLAIKSARARACRENLMRIDAAKEQWALERLLSNGTVLPEDWLDNPNVVNPNGYLKKKPICPDGGKYKVNPIGEEPECSIGTSLDPTNPSLWHKIQP